MVLGGSRNKAKTNPPSGAQQSKCTAKKAPFTSERLPSGKEKKHTAKSTFPMATPTNFTSDSEENDTSNAVKAASQDDTVPSGLLKQFEKMLHKALKQTSDQITTNLTREIRELGNRTEVLEAKTEEIEVYTQECLTEIDLLKEENLTLQNRLEDYENRARRSNLRFRGIPESVVDLQSTILALCQELLPDTAVERLEMDRVHRALTPKKADGPPRDIIAKFHFYRTKEQILEAAREKSNLSFQSHNYQIFADISQLTIAKRRAMKPLLIELQQRNIKYQWGFPFSLRFTYQGTKIVCRSPDQLHQALMDFKLIEKSSTASNSRRRAASTSSHNNSTQHEQNGAFQQSNKRGRYAPQPQDQEDSMD